MTAKRIQMVLLCALAPLLFGASASREHFLNAFVASAYAVGALAAANVACAAGRAMHGKMARDADENAAPPA